MRILIVGRGRLGGSFVRGLRAAGDDVGATAGRTPSKAALRHADVVVLAVPDGAIAAVTARVVPSLRPGTVVLHAAGNRGVLELSAAAEAGHPVGVLHPFVSLIGRADASTFAGTTFVASGTKAALRAARAITRALGARLVVADVHGPVYHAAAAVTANGAVALVHAAQAGLRSLGLTRQDADAALAGLLASVARNVADVGVPAALTGPVVRGDADAVRRHRRALADVPALGAAYEALATPLVACARAAGLDDDVARAVEAAYEAPVDATGAPRGTRALTPRRATTAGPRRPPRRRAPRA